MGRYTLLTGGDDTLAVFADPDTPALPRVSLLGYLVNLDMGSKDSKSGMVFQGSKDSRTAGYAHGVVVNVRVQELFH